VLNVSILGNGPSIKFFKGCSSHNNLIIGTNNIFYLKQFNILNPLNTFYTVYEERFFKNKKTKIWLNEVKNLKGEVFFPNDWKNRVELKNIPNINFSLPRSNEKIIKNYLKMFCDKKDLKSSVIIECAIPLAISLKAKLINLYGCEFKYKLDNKANLTKNSYFYTQKNDGFEHTKKSEKIWSEIQYLKLKRIKIFLTKHDIVLRDMTINGRLKFI
jgi:hypothetical protein